MFDFLRDALVTNCARYPSLQCHSPEDTFWPTKTIGDEEGVKEDL